MCNFKEANFSVYRDKLKEYNWENCFENDDIHVDVISDRMNLNILEAAKMTIPNRKVATRPVINLGTLMNFGNLSDECCEC